MMARALFLVLALTFHTCAIVVSAIVLGKYLEQKIPLTFTWLAVTFPVAIILIIHNYYVFFRYLAKKDKS